MSKILDAAGNPQDVQLDVSVYREAAEAYMSVPQFINSKYATNSEKYGSSFEQLLASQGLFVRADRQFGIRPATMKQIVEGNAVMNAGTVTRDASPASRILFPAVILEAMENKLKTDFGSYLSLFDKMIAISDSINGPRFEQPILNFSKPEAARSQVISQLALPASMLSITVSDVSRKIPTVSLGMEISNEALQATTLDLVSLALTRQAEIESAANVDAYITSFQAGDVDLGMAALVAKTQTVLDAAPVGGALTHKAWVKWLRTGWRIRHIDWVMCDLATALKIENRTGKPTIQSDDPNSKRINPVGEIVNPAWQNVKIFLLEDGVIPADMILGLDSRYAIRRVRNAQAEYQAVEEFVLRKSKAMRFDYGEICYRLFDTAFDLLQIV
jgi:hypothetical protein